MANKIKLARGLKNKIETVKANLEDYEIVYAYDTKEIGIKTGAELVWYPNATNLSGKVDKVSGKVLSTNDYTTADKNKLSGIQEGAQKNVGVEFTQAEKTKLSGVQTGAQKNPTFKTVGGQSIVGTGDIPVSGGSEYVLTKSKIDTALQGDWINSIQLGSGATASKSLSIGIGRLATSSGDSSTAIGVSASAPGRSSTALGHSAKANADYSTALGASALVASAGNTSTALGYSAQTGSSTNLIQLGSGSGLSTLRSRVNLTVTSDIRDKTDIEEVPKALDFIKDLNPITYVSNDRENYISDEQKETDTYKDYLMVEDYDRKSHSQGTKKGSRRRVGLSAQEVREKLIEHYGSDNYASVVNDNFVEFKERNLDVPKDLENKLTMSYETMVPFLIKAIQEQQEQIEELKKKINKG